MPGQVTRRAATIASFLLMGAGHAWTVAAAPHRSAAEIRQDLDTAEAQLRRGDHSPEPLTRAFLALHEHRITGDQELRVVAMAFLLRGLVAAANRNEIDAGIDWTAALALDPGLAEFDLGPYGAAGAALRSAGSRALEIGGRAVDGKALGEPKPRLIRDARFLPPRYIRECGQARVSLDAWFDESGRIRGFRNPEATCDRGLVVPAISAFRQRTYEPATDREGRPIPVWLRATVNFRMAPRSLFER